ncbi:TPR-like protein [Crassisporium funariophilum]|nr:TPR-like protein [Crassisporium funariophilum]
MSFAKSRLKAARDHIGKKDYLSAKNDAIQVLEYEPDNYNAHVFLGLALLELGEFEQSEQMYSKATKLNQGQLLAWQGISKLYERTEKWDKYAETLIELMNLYESSQDAVKCAETLQKLIAVQRTHGSRSQLISQLSYYLPGSVYYAVLSTLPEPDPTNPTGSTISEARNAIHNGLPILEEIVDLTESSEEDTYNREVEKRRMRLGAASPEQLRKDVLREICKESKLPVLYDAILNQPSTSDELRRLTESKLLRWKERYLHSIPMASDTLAIKRQISQELDEMINGIVLLHTPDELGWQIFFDGKDCEDMSGYDQEHVREYINLFPESALALLFKGYLAFKNTPISDDEESLNDTQDDPLDIVLNAYTSLSKTIIGNRIIGEIHLHEEDFENAIKTSKLGLEVLDKLESNTGKSLLKTRAGLQVILATSLVHFFPPKHHKQASAIIDEVLSRSPNNTSCLMGRAFILQAALEWENAAAVFDQISSLLPDDLDVGLRAREEAAWCRCQLGHSETGLQELQQILIDLSDLSDDSRNSDCARCLWRIGKCHMDIGVPNVENAYKSFIAALKRDSGFAPAFTSLGIYYSENATPPDPLRASKCFQKAFELDPRESVAARRLVEGFADDREWDLVEVVAQRTIDGEGGLNAGLEKSELDATSRYLPLNSWAWKAIGVVKFHYKDYPSAIQAFQVALRVEPEDQALWVRLGEAYNKAGRHVASLKALHHAHELDPDDWLCSYFIADVKQRMGLFEEAIVILEAIRVAQPAEAGVLSLLAQAHLDLGRMEVGDGFEIRAEASFVAAIEMALEMIELVPGFRTMAWKVISDAAFQLSLSSAFVDEAGVRDALQAIVFLPSPDSAEKLVKLIPPPIVQDGNTLTGLHVISVTIHACLSQISLHSLNQTSNSTAWYDIGVALQSWLSKAPSSVDAATAHDLIVECLSKGLQADASNDQYWVALGNAHFLSHAKAAQHAYIKALEIDAKNSGTWVNLGLMYFYHGDVEVANEAFYRAQVLDPDNTAAWLGQFLLATANGDDADAHLLLEHAVGLTNPIAEADYEFAYRVFKTPQEGDKPQDSLLRAFFLLNRYCQRRPSEVSGLHLLAIVCERLGHFTFAEAQVERAIGILETAYEETEDPEVEHRYTIANATLGRLRLAQGDFGGSIASFESALGLLAEKDDGEDEGTRVVRVQAHLGLGLAHFYRGELEEALAFLEDGLGCAGEDGVLRGQIMIVLGQTLWAIGTEESRETAKSRLLECISSDPENLAAINTLAGMGILADDDGLVDAAFSEILALPIDQKHKLDPERHVDYLLVQHHLAQDDSKHALSVAQHAVSAEPSSLEQRNRLTSLMIQNGNTESGLALLMASAQSENNNGGEWEKATVALSMQAVALAMHWDDKADKGDLGRQALRRAQRAIMGRPSELRGWQTLAYVCARWVRVDK